MSLVNYEYSDDEEEEINEETKSVVLKPQEVQNSQVADKNDEIKKKEDNKSSLNNLFSNLNKSVKRNNQGRVQIKAFDQELMMIPDDSDSDDEKNERKRIRKSDKGSGLISMLPKPRNKTKTKVPGSTTLSSMVPNSVSKITANSKENEKDVPKNFFFVESDDDNDDDHLQRNSVPKLVENLGKFPVSHESGPVYGPSKIAEAPEESVSYLDPNDDVTFKKFIASKFDDEVSNVKIVDVNLSQHLSENKDWLKNISLEKDLDHEELDAKAPNSTARRKNQITFLAYQAKKQELALKNQWAQNRASKSQTRAKYGF